MTRDIYDELGVTPVINAATTLTALGGTTLPEEVVEAIVAAGASCVDMFELHDAASRRLAHLTRNEDAYVTSGCAAAIVLCVLASITKGRPETIARLPADATLERRVVIHCAHRIPYERAIHLAGGRIVQIGNVIQTLEWELDAALDEGAAAVVWIAGSHLPTSTLSLEHTVSRAHDYGVPVIVDAAAQLPPLSNLWHFTRDLGVDAALFSGGKALQGPQASGLIVGRRDFLDAARANASPHQRLARALKVGKEEIAGLVAALERYVELDHDVLYGSWEARVEQWRHQLSGLNGVLAERDPFNEAGQPVPRLRLTFDSRRVDTVVATLWNDTPRVAVYVDAQRRMYLSPDGVTSDADAQLVAVRVRRALATSAIKE